MSGLVLFVYYFNCVNFHQILMNVRTSMEDVKYTVSIRMAHTIVIVKKVTALLLMIPHVGVSPDRITVYTHYYLIRQFYIAL